MNNIINQLSQIEEKTVAILDGAADKKKNLAAEYEAKTKQFDEEPNHETELEIQSMGSLCNDLSLRKLAL